MERNQRNRSRPGREHRSEGSRRPYSDDQETYRNPRNEYRDDDRGDDFELSQSPDRDVESDESNRYRTSERGYGSRDLGYADDSRERYEPGLGAQRQGPSHDRYGSGPDEFSGTQPRRSRDDRYCSEPHRSEPRSRNWPHSRAGGRVSEYGYFGEERERQGQGERQQGGSPYGPGSGREPGYGSRQQGSVQFGAYGEPREQSVYTERRFGENYSGRGPRNYSRSDERIKEDICDELLSDPECDAEDIEIEVKDGVASLSGTVPSRRMKHRAEDIADAARGVKDVDNRIRVTGRVGRSQRGSASRGQDGNESLSSSNGRSRKESQPASRSSRKQN